MTEIDFRILDFIREKLSNGFFDFAMPKLTAVGNIGLIWIFIAAAMVISRNTDAAASSLPQDLQAVHSSEIFC